MFKKNIIYKAIRQLKNHFVLRLSLAKKRAVISEYIKGKRVKKLLALILITLKLKLIVV